MVKQKVNLYLDSEIWHQFQKRMIEVNSSASREIEKFIGEYLHYSPDELPQELKTDNPDPEKNITPEDRVNGLINAGIIAKMDREKGR